MDAGVEGGDLGDWAEHIDLVDEPVEASTAMSSEPQPAARAPGQTVVLNESVEKVAMDTPRYESVLHATPAENLGVAPSAAHAPGWTAEEDARLAQLVEITAAASGQWNNKSERWAHIASELGGGRSVASIRLRWAERTPTQSGVGSGAHRERSIAASASASSSWATAAVNHAAAVVSAAAEVTNATARANAAAAAANASIDESPAEARGPPGWGVDDCRQLGHLVRRFEAESRRQAQEQAAHAKALAAATAAAQAPPATPPRLKAGRTRVDRWELIADELCGSALVLVVVAGGAGVSAPPAPRFSGRDCRGCWLEHMQPDPPTAALEVLSSATVSGSREVQPSELGDMMNYSGGGFTQYKVRY